MSINHTCQFYTGYGWVPATVIGHVNGIGLNRYRLRLQDGTIVNCPPLAVR